MIVASLVFSLMSALVKTLGPDFPFMQGVFYRSLFGFVLLVPLIKKEKIALKPNFPKLVLVRSFFGTVAMTSHFYALQRGVLADISVILRMQPIFIALLAPFLIRESTSRTVGISTILGFLGVALIIQPQRLGEAFVNLPGIMALVSTLCSALAHITIRHIGDRDHPALIVTHFTFFSMIIGGLGMISHYVTPTPIEWVLLVAIAFGSTIGQLLMTTAYKLERAATVSAVSYSTVLFSGFLGYLFWHEVPQLLAIVGSVLVIGAGLLLTLSKSSL